MKLEEFILQGETLSDQAGVRSGSHGYFKLHAVRLHACCKLFRLFNPLGDVMEIGPFYGYTPFILQKHSKSYCVLEGDDPAVLPLEPLYSRNGIQFSRIDLFEMFGPTFGAPHKLPFPDASFDTILCWETMEHFNFNPVKFVRELARVLKPGGRVCITVPNKASFQNLAASITGRFDEATIQYYFKYENYESNGKRAFYGFHWREYSPSELQSLFRGCGFNIESSGSFTAFQGLGPISTKRRVLRVFSQYGTKILPRHGTNVYLSAKK